MLILGCTSDYFQACDWSVLADPVLSLVDAGKPCQPLSTNFKTHRL